MPSQDSRPDRKRRRIAIACNECRDRKRKCDGVKPVCGSCTKRASVQCIWEEGRVAKGWSQSYVDSLRCRIQELEEGQAIDGEPSSAAPARWASQEGDTMPPAVSVSPTATFRREGSEPSSDRQTLLPSETAPVTGTDIVPDITSQASLYDLAATGYQHDSRPAFTDRDSAVEEAEADDDSTVDAMGVFGSIGNRNRQGSDFFGPSSTLSFLSHARRAMSERATGTDRHQQRDALMGLFRDEAISMGESPRSSIATVSSKSSNLAGHRLSIPTRTQADALLDSYWVYLHSLYPFLHRPSFNERYFALWTPASSHIFTQNSGSQQGRNFYVDLDDRLFHCMLNLVFALGSQFSDTVDDSEQSQLGMSFFERAKDLMNFDMLAQGNIHLVQMLLLMSLYLQSTDLTSACWNMVGLSIRVAQGIGLHQEPNNRDQGYCLKGNWNQLETEMRRRAWAGCILFDTVLSMTYGRPLMIQASMSQNSIPPLAIDDEFMSQDPARPSTQPESTPSLTECYAQSIKLQNILSQALHTLSYGSADEERAKNDINFKFMATNTANDRLRNGELQMLLNIDKSLTTWNRNLPDFLKAQNYKFRRAENTVFGPRTQTFNRQAIILYARYLHVRLIMFRPMLSALFSSDSVDTPQKPESSMESTMHQGILEKGVNLCVASATDLVDLITENFDTGNDILPPPWHNVFYIHSCSMVFLICRLCYIDRIQNKEALVKGWNKCLAFFRMYRKRSRSARRCLKILQAAESGILFSQTYTNQNSASRNRDPENAAQPVSPYTDWCQNISQNAPQSFENFSLTDQAAANWLNDPSEINWLSVFPFVESLDSAFSWTGQSPFV